MSIEQSILVLAEAINNLTKVVIQSAGCEDDVELVAPKQKVESTKQKAEPVASKQKVETTKSKAKVEEDEKVTKDDLFDEDEDEIVSKDATVDEVKKLAKDKMSEGVDRTKIKNLITKLGGESISDLNQVSLNKFRDQLNEM